MKNIDVLSLVKTHEQEIISDIKDMVSIRSDFDKDSVSNTQPYGKHIANVFAKMQEKANEYNIETKNLNNRCLEIKFEGTSNKRFGIMSHLDTVPVTNSWKTDPYELTRIGDKFYGRGSSDDKGPSIMVLWALKLYKHLNLTPKYDIVCLFGGDEERGSSDLKYYFKHNPTFDFGFSPDSDFPIIYLEKSYTHYKISKTYQTMEEVCDYKILELNGGSKINVVCDFVDVKLSCANEKALNKLIKICEQDDIYFEKNELILNLQFSGVAAHAKQPQNGQNAIWKFAQTFSNLKVDKTSQDYIKFLNNYFVDDVFGKKLGIFDEDEHTFSTNNLALISYSENEFSIEFNYRSTLSTDLELINNKLKKLVEVFNFNVDVLEQDKPHYVDKNSQNIKILANAYKQVMNESVELGVNGGRTYASSCENTVSFGPLFKSEESKIHSDEESISLKTIINVTAIYLQLLINISN